MSAVLEQSASDLDYLIGAKVASVSMLADDDEWGFDVIELILDLAGPKQIDGETCHRVAMQVWQDPEGNGPGFLALTAAWARS